MPPNARAHVELRAAALKVRAAEDRARVTAAVGSQARGNRTARSDAWGLLDTEHELRRRVATSFRVVIHFSGE